MSDSWGREKSPQSQLSGLLQCRIQGEAGPSGPWHISDFTRISSFRMKNSYGFPILDYFRINFPVVF